MLFVMRAHNVIEQNFKVRINAALALSVPGERALFVDALGGVVRGLAAVLEAAEGPSPGDLREYRSALLRREC